MYHTVSVDCIDWSKVYVSVQIFVSTVMTMIAHYMVQIQGLEVEGGVEGKKETPEGEGGRLLVLIVPPFLSDIDWLMPLRGWPL